MNEKIQHIISDIRKKKDALQTSLEQQMEKNNHLAQEIIQLTTDVESNKTEISQLKEDNTELKSLLEEAKNQIVKPAKTDNVSQEQINELVREIEYCIGQLKNNA